MDIESDWMDWRAGVYGDSRENENVRRLVEISAERMLCVGNIYVESKSLHKYARVARGQDEVEVKSMIDLVLMKRDMLLYVQDVMVVKGMRRLSDHSVLLCIVRLLGAWIKRRKVVNKARRIRSLKLREHQYREGYARSLECKRVESNGKNNVEHMWRLKA